MNEFPADNPTFEQSLAELEEIVRELENGEIGLEESLSRYEKGVGLLKRCYAQLQAAEKRIMRLGGVDEEGRPIGEQFEHAATAESVRADNKHQRKSNDEPESLF